MMINKPIMMQEYYEQMPWTAVPFGEYAIRRSLMDTFKISGIPALIILGPEGEVVNANARSDIMKDPNALKFPWKGSKNLNSGPGWVIEYTQSAELTSSKLPIQTKIHCLQI